MNANNEDDPDLKRQNTPCKHCGKLENEHPDDQSNCPGFETKDD